MGRSSDPFLVLVVGDGERGIERRTKVAKRTRKPTWEEELVFHTSDRPRALTVNCCSWDKQKQDTSIGSLTIPLEQRWVVLGAEESGMMQAHGALLDDTALEWFALDGVKRGQVCLALECTVRPGRVARRLRAMDESSHAAAQLHEAVDSVGSLERSVPMLVSLCAASAPVVASATACALWRLSSMQEDPSADPPGSRCLHLLRDSKALPVFVGVLAAALSAEDDAVAGVSIAAAGARQGPAEIAAAAQDKQKGLDNEASPGDVLAQWWRAAFNACGAIEQMCSSGIAASPSEVLECGGVPLLLEIACNDGSRGRTGTSTRQRLLASSATAGRHSKPSRVTTKKKVTVPPPPLATRCGALRALFAVAQDAGCQAEIRAHGTSYSASRLRFGGGIAGLVHLLHEEELELVENAAALLGQLGWGSEENQAAVREAGGLDPLVDLLRAPQQENGDKEGDEDGADGICAGSSTALSVQTTAATAVWHLSHSPENQDHIRAAGGIEALAQMMMLRRETRAERRRRRGGPAAAEKAASATEVEAAIAAACGALADVCWGNVDNTAALRQQSGTSMLLVLCEHRAAPVRAAATRAIWNCIVSDEKMGEQVREQHGMDAIVKLLTDTDSEVLSNAAGIMENLL